MAACVCVTAMKRRAAEIAAIKLCKSPVDNESLRSRSRDRQSSLADKTQDKKNDASTNARSHDRRAVKRKSSRSDNSVDRKSSLRSSHPLIVTSADSKSVTSKRDVRQKTDASTEQPASSSDTDTEVDDSTDTELSQPVKQRKLGNYCLWLYPVLYIKRGFLIIQSSHPSERSGIALHEQWNIAVLVTIGRPDTMSNSRLSR